MLWTRLSNINQRFMGMDVALFEIKKVASRVLEPVSFSIEAGACLGLTGPSGSGKTLLLRQLVDLDPRIGEVWLHGRSINSVPAHVWRKSVALLPAESQWWHDIVGEHFATFNKKTLLALGFDVSVMKWQISRLSSGEKQRLALLRLLENKPHVLLLDEPTANLDVKFIGRVEYILSAYKKQHNAALLWVSHDRSQLQRMADTLFEIQDKRLREVSYD